MSVLDGRVKILVCVLLLVSFAVFLAYTIYLTIPMPANVEPTKYEWNFNINEPLGWTMANGFTSAQLTEEGLATEVVDFDPYMHSPQVRILSEKQSKIVVAMKISGNASILKLYWITDRSPLWDEDKTTEIPTEADGELHEYVLDLADHSMWKGSVTMFRFDLEPPDCYGTQMSMRYVKLPILGPEFKIKGPYLSSPIPISNTKFQVKVKIHNTGVERLNLRLSLKANPPMEALEGETIEIRGLEPRAEQSASWSLITNEAGLYEAEIKVFSNIPENISYVVKFPVFPEIRVENGIPPEAPDGITITGNGSFVVKARETLVYLIRNSFGYGPVIILLKGEEKWEPVGAFGCFASITLVREAALKERIQIVPHEANLDNNSLIFKCLEDYDWIFSSTWKVENQSIKVENRLDALKGVNVTQFSSALYPGETSFASFKDEALLPGLEWLVSDEHSSNTLDIASPFNLRNSPHPLKVTIPLMAVRYSDALVAMLWDPYHTWDGVNSPLSLQFASPNWVEGQNNHLFMLFVPTVPRWVKENYDEAHEPYRLEMEKQLSLSFRVYVARSDTVLDAVREWFRIYGLPEPVMPRELEEETDLSMEAYLNSLWVPEEGWRHASGWDPEPFPGYALLLYLTSLVEEEHVLKAKIIDRFNETVQLVLKNKGPGYLASGDGCHIPGWQLPFHIGYLEKDLTYTRSHIRSLISSQGPDGEWGFQPDEKTRELGAAGSREVGITATYAAEILRWARITGDKNALSAGLNALKAMQKYMVPRGAQTWEIPLHSPDVLASSKALEAYLEAYIATGDQKYLERAKYWALTGLPFIYLWSPSDRYIMLYASIPVYGATFYKAWVWIGRPVQWCGLVYAYHLLRLSKYDDSFPWRTLGEGILSSGMRQQVTSGSLVGTYPDSWDLIADTQYGPCINPESIVKCTLFLLGLDPDLNSLVLRGPAGDVTVTSSAKILYSNLEGEVLRVRLSYFKGETSYLLVYGFQAEFIQKIDYGDLSYAEDLEAVDEGWKITSDRFIIIKVSFTETETESLFLKQ